MVSVIITTYGGSGKLKRAIDSVLAQTYKDFEIIVVDDNNPESQARKKTECIMTEYSEDSRVLYIKHSKNRNGAAARNTGEAYARGEYIAYLDDDDVYLPEKIEKSVCLIEEKKVGAACFGVAIVNQGFITGLIQKANGEFLSKEKLLCNEVSIGTGSNIFIKKSIVEQVKGFDEEFNRFQDVEFMLRVVQHSKVIYCNDVLVIKDVSDVRTLRYQIVKDAQEIFNRKFQTEINYLTNSKKNTYYKERHLRLYLLAKIGADKKEIKEAGCFLKEYDDLSLKHKIELNCPTIVSWKWKMKEFIKNGFFKQIYVKIKRLQNKLKDKEYRVLLGKQRYELIHSFLK